MNICTLFNMGQYNVYVWPAYGITFFVFAINLFSAWRSKQQTKRRLQQYLKKHKTHHESKAKK